KGYGGSPPMGIRAGAPRGRGEPDMRRKSRLHLGLALAAAALPISCGGCERRVEEPLPEVRPLTRTSEAAATKPWGSRCVRERPRRAGRKPPPTRAPRSPLDPENPPALRTGKVTFEDPKAPAITVEIAENDHDRQRGLMYRKEMPADRGMIFWFAEKTDHSFW